MTLIFCRTVGWIARQEWARAMTYQDVPFVYTVHVENGWPSTYAEPISMHATERHSCHDPGSQWTVERLRGC